MMMMDDPKIEDAEAEPIYNNHLCRCLYKNLEWTNLDIRNWRRCIPKNLLHGCDCNSVDWTCFDFHFVVKVGFGLRI